MLSGLKLWDYSDFGTFFGFFRSVLTILDLWISWISWIQSLFCNFMDFLDFIVYCAILWISWISLILLLLDWTSFLGPNNHLREHRLFWAVFWKLLMQVAQFSLYGPQCGRLPLAFATAVFFCCCCFSCVHLPCGTLSDIDDDACQPIKYQLPSHSKF